MDQNLLGQIIGGLFVGLLVGLAPLIVGVRKGKPSMGVAGFFASVLSGVFGGVILAAPVGVIFLWLILRKSKNRLETERTLEIKTPKTE